MSADAAARPVPVVAIAGASGFVGRALCRLLVPGHRVIELSRSPAPRADESPPRADARSNRISRRCDLFSLLETERALAGADVAVYLVHSMLPSSRLTQGRFEDLDLICADNFARAARLQGVKRIVYLGGLVPELPDEATLSPHLRSRLEVERALAAHGVPLRALRASLVLGAGGSSFELMVRLVERLPLMVCPAWARTPTQPIALADVVKLLAFAVDDDALPAGAYDVAGPDIVDYRRLMEMTARELDLRRTMVRVPLFSPGLSRLWVTLITGAPRALVAPLVQSLRHPMVARDQRLQERAGVPGIRLAAALSQALAARSRQGHPRHVGVTRRARSGNDVRSVQRLSIPAGRDGRWIADEYLRWLPRHFRIFLHVDVTRSHDEGRPAPILCRFRLRPMRRALIELRFSPERSTLDRPLFYLSGGLLARRGSSRGRLEFREISEPGTALAALHDFVPRLPFRLYVATQGLIHRLTMAAFARHLRSLARTAHA
jgi:uncharacterized protein YbjT (DUF2867 family)